MKIAITTVFLPRENIYWIEEWIRYHLFHIGIDAIYLYDNTGSLRFDHLPVIKNISVTLSGKNYKDEDISSVTSHISDKDIRNILDGLVKKYTNRVFIVPWHPVDKEGVLCYGQREAYADFISQYGAEFDWVCLTDIDEFIVNTDLREKISSFEKRGYNDIIIHPKLFTQRFGSRGPVFPALSITDYIENVTDRYWKQIVKCSDAYYPQIHQGGTWKGDWKPVFNTGLIFHHYKVGPWYYQRMRDEIAFCPKILNVGTDDLLKKILLNLHLENNIKIPLPKDITLFQQGARNIVLPSTSFMRKIISIKEYVVVYTIFHSRFLRKIWMILKPDKPSSIRVTD